MLNQRSDKVELLRIVEAVATEKSIDAEIILSSMESAIQKAAKTRFGSENDIRAKIDRESGNISLHKVLTIVEIPENLDTEIALKQAKKMQNKETVKIVKGENAWSPTKNKNIIKECKIILNKLTLNNSNKLINDFIFKISKISCINKIINILNEIFKKTLTDNEFHDIYVI